MNRIEFPHAARNSLVDPDTVKPARGKYMGEAVELNLDPGFQLEDLVEEIGMAIAYRGSRQQLDGRRLRSARNLDERTIERIGKYRLDLPQLPGAAAIQRLLERLHALEPASDADDDEGKASELRQNVQAELEAYDRDVTHQYAALELVLEHLEGQQIDPRLLKALLDVRASFDEATRRRDVRAGFAAALPASESAAIGADPSEVRATYRRMIAEVGNMAKLFQLLREFDLGRKFTKVISIFTSAAARDLASTGPSTDRSYIRALMVELDKLRKAKGVVLMAADLMRLTNRHLEDGEQVEGSEMELAGDVLAFACKERPGYADARELLRLHEASPMTVKIVFANGLRDLHGELPAAVCPSLRAYLAQREAILRMLEVLVESEEAEFQATGNAAR